MRATISGKTQDGMTFSFEQEAEPKVIASGVNKGEARERDLGEFLSHVSQQVLRATEPMDGVERSKMAELSITVTY